MNIVWFSWKDRKHPRAGGAETVSGEIMDRLVRDGHSVRHITASYPGALPRELFNGTEVLRTGNRYTVYWNAFRLYKKYCTGWADVVIDEMNTIPFASTLYSKRKNVMLVHQLAREVWFYQMAPPLSLIGYILEPLYLHFLSKRYSSVLVVSESTRKDLERFGFPHNSIHTFRIGRTLSTTSSVGAPKKQQTALSLGSIRPMKRTLEAVKAFEFARDQDSSLQMVIAGDASGAYARKIKQYIHNSRHAAAISVRGRVSNQEKGSLMREASVLLATSVKEGWGLIVTEANSQGTPAVVYNVDGLRDSVKDKETGIVVKDKDARAMGNAIIALLKDRQMYRRLQKNAWRWSQQFTFENSYQDFFKLIQPTGHTLDRLIIDRTQSVQPKNDADLRVKTD